METGKFMNENCYRYARSSSDNERVRWEQSLTPENLHFKFFFSIPPRHLLELPVSQPGRPLSLRFIKIGRALMPIIGFSLFVSHLEIDFET
jgi:hypothetical protein